VESFIFWCLVSGICEPILTIESNRILGAVAACLIAVGVVSQVAGVVSYSLQLSGMDLALLSAVSVLGILSFVGFILYLVAMHGFSKDYDENRIFDYVLYGFIIAIVVGIILAGVFIASVFSSMLSNFHVNNPPDPSQITSLVTKSVAPFLPAFGIAGLIYVVLSLLAFNLLADNSGVSFFRTGAKVLVAGAVLGVVLELVSAVLFSVDSISYGNVLVLSFPSVLVQDAAWALLAMAFLRIRPEPAQSQVPVSPGIS
jgi:uncharacterized membrane protein